MRAFSFLLLLAACPRGPDVTRRETPPAAPSWVASEGLERDLAASRAFWETRPPAERPLETGSPATGAALSAATCATCHAQVAEDWALSPHAAAWTDPGFQGERAQSSESWRCLRCHTPLLAQQEAWARADSVVKSAIFDAALREEGVTCAACHLRDGAVHGPGLGGDAPHAVVADAAFRTGTMCLDCHEADAAHAGSTGTEWRASDAARAGKTCVTCHMPAGRHHPLAEGRGSALDVDVRREGFLLRVDLSNARAGHALPTGDPDRYLGVDVRFLDDAGAVVGQPPTIRIGQKWEWEPVPRRILDDRLPPGGGRTSELPIPEGSVMAEVVVRSYRTGVDVETHRLQVDLTAQ